MTDRTELHPDVTIALAALSRIKLAWQYLADQLEPGPATTGERILTPAARGNLDRLVRAERADRLATIKHGAIPAGASPAPLRVAVLDGQVLVLTTICDQAWLVSSTLRTRRVLIGPQVTWTPYGEDDARVHGAAGYLGVALRLVDLGLVREVGQSLSDVDRLARAIAGVGSDRRRLNAECPACGGRSLEADVGSANEMEWTVQCSRAACRCRGIECGCALPLRYGSMRHIWPAKRFGELARVLDRQAA